MNVQLETSTALTPIDGFADTGDASASPLRGIAFRFNDGNYVTISDPFPTKDRVFAAFDKSDGWQKLPEGVPPEYLMRQPGKMRPPRPHVDEKDWPLDLNGTPAHPWRLTRYLYLLDTKTGELSTFWTNTIGGERAFQELADQVRFMRGAQSDVVVPLIALESTMMPTQYGSKKPRPFFRILGYKSRSQIGSQNLPSDATETPLIEAKTPTLNEEMGDGLPADLAPPKKHKK